MGYNELKQWMANQGNASRLDLYPSSYVYTSLHRHVITPHRGDVFCLDCLELEVGMCGIATFYPSHIIVHYYHVGRVRVPRETCRLALNKCLRASGIERKFFLGENRLWYYGQKHGWNLPLPRRENFKLNYEGKSLIDGVVLG